MQVVGCPLYILLYCGLFAFLAVMVDYRAELVVFILYMRSDASLFFLVEGIFDFLLAEGIGLAQINLTWWTHSHWDNFLTFVWSLANFSRLNVMASRAQTITTNENNVTIVWVRIHAWRFVTDRVFPNLIQCGAFFRILQVNDVPYGTLQSALCSLINSRLYCGFMELAAVIAAVTKRKYSLVSLRVLLRCWIILCIISGVL